MSEDKPIGQLFTHVYLDRGQPAQDSELFRRRLGGYIGSTIVSDRHNFAAFIKAETGLSVPHYNFENFFVETPIQYVLNIITLVWRYHWIQVAIHERRVKGCLAAKEWKDFVARVLREENIGYILDEQCGVHFLVDQEFEHNKVAILRGLSSPRYLGVKAAFEAAYAYLDSTPTDTKASVRSMFESLEILTKLMVQTNNLNKWIVENTLKQTALEVFGSDDIASATIGSVFDGFARWVDGLHNYRHGQGKTEPVAPSLNLTIYVLSSGAAFLRWLLEIDHELQSRNKTSLNRDSLTIGEQIS